MVKVTVRRIRSVAAQWLLNPGPPGVIGAAVGLAVALLPAQALESLRQRAIIVSAVAVAWALVAAIYGIANQERAHRKQIAREARQWTHDVWILFLGCFSAEWDVNHNRIPDPAVDRELAEKLRLEQISVREQYFKLYAEPVQNFLEDLDEEGLLNDRSALALSKQMKQSNAPEYADVQEMLNKLAAIAKDLQN